MPNLHGEAYELVHDVLDADQLHQPVADPPQHGADYASNTGEDRVSQCTQDEPVEAEEGDGIRTRATADGPEELHDGDERQAHHHEDSQDQRYARVLCLPGYSAHQQRQENAEQARRQRRLPAFADCSLIHHLPSMLTCHHKPVHGPQHRALPLQCHAVLLHSLSTITTTITTTFTSAFYITTVIPAGIGQVLHIVVDPL